MQSNERLESSESISSDNNVPEQSGIKQSHTIPKPDVNSSMVYLNIYDLDPVSKVVNSVVKSIGTGAFHAGVEVYGFEYSFGYIPGGQTGVMKTQPRYHPYHVYRESIPMSNPINESRSRSPCRCYETPMDWRHLRYIIKARYYEKNVGSIPEWVMSLQKNLNWVKSNISVASSKLKELNKASGLPNVLNYVRKKGNKNDESPKK
ncbi:hypothetical protein YYG_02527 [Plasmodium vinckei petteri]|uniref:PPPDE domain-containing protein n=1 Tax=Plasmodium vinckei petteri TaxID=138298 RepID=W7B448_PLAVN|nr:hypothetical protein YYG_02527 [Plasmodium vinckei petteri]